MLRKLGIGLIGLIGGAVVLAILLAPRNVQAALPVSLLDWKKSRINPTSRDLWDLDGPLAENLATDGWGQPRPGRKGTHYGLDLRAAIGTPVYAMADGEVADIDTSRKTPGGITVRIKHANGMSVNYAHLSRVVVTYVGQKVFRARPGVPATRIALTGITAQGTSNVKTGPHLHMTIRLDKAYLPAYIAAYGTPKSGFFERKAIGIAVPVEPLFPMKYKSSVIAEAKVSGVPLYRPTVT